MKENVVVISHWKDLDGIASAAIVYRKHGRCRMYWCEPQNLNVQLKRSLSLGRGLSVVIADLGPNLKTIGEVVELLREHKRAGNRIYWYDHHVWREEIQREVEGIVDRLIVDRGKCAAMIVYENENPDDEVSRKLAELACDSDFWIKSIELTVKLDKVVASGLDRNYIVKVLASGRFWNERFERAYRERVEREREMIEEALSKVRGLTLRGGVRVAVVTGNYPSSLLGEELARRGYHVIAVVSPRGGVSLRRGSDRINLLPIAERLGGGGHPFAAGGSLDYGLLDRLLARLGYYRKLKSLYRAIEEGLSEVEARDILEHDRSQS